MSHSQGPWCHANSIPVVKTIPSLCQAGHVRLGRGSDVVTSRLSPVSPVDGLDSPLSEYVIIVTHMARRKRPLEDAKTTALRTAGALHPHPEAVQDPVFGTHEFFDARDRVQVKYEMLRRHRVDGRPVTEVATAFGVSRQAFYGAEAVFTGAGLPGLLPRRRGPKRAHKCTEAILDFAEQQWAEDPARRHAWVVSAIHQQFGIRVHPRSLARALVRRKKNRPTPRETTA
jgi:transposase